MNSTQHPPELEQRLRHTLHTVAGTITETGPATTAAMSAPTAKRRRNWRIGLGVGAVAIPLALAAAAIVDVGPEYVDAIPPEQVVTSGSVGGSRYLLIESDRTNKCGDPVTGVELVEEDENLFGNEWNTTGYQYGDATWLPGCGDSTVDTSRFLKNPALFSQSGAQVGDSFVWVYAVHPDVTGVRITAGDYTKELTVHEVDGAGYAPFEIPTDVENFTSELLIDNQVVPGSRLDRRVPQMP